MDYTVFDSPYFFVLSRRQQRLAERLFKLNFKRLVSDALRFRGDYNHAKETALVIVNKWLKRFSEFTSEEEHQNFLTAQMQVSCREYVNKLKPDAPELAKHFRSRYLNESDADSKLIANELATELEIAICDLPIVRRQVFKMLFCLSMPVAVVAQLNGMKEQNVRNHKTNAINSLKKALTRKGFLVLMMILGGVISAITVDPIYLLSHS